MLTWSSVLLVVGPNNTSRASASATGTLRTLSNATRTADTNGSTHQSAPAVCTKIKEGAFFLLIVEKAGCLTLDVFLSGGVYSDTFRSILVVTLTRPIIRYSLPSPVSTYSPNRYLGKLGEREGGVGVNRVASWRLARLSDAGLVPGVEPLGPWCWGLQWSPQG